MSHFIEKNCVEQIFKMFLEMRIAEIRTALKETDRASQKLASIYYTNAVKFITRQMRRGSIETNLDIQRQHLITTYRYFVRELSFRYCQTENGLVRDRRGYTVMIDAMVRASPLIQNGTNGELFLYLLSITPRFVLN